MLKLEIKKAIDNSYISCILSFSLLILAFQLFSQSAEGKFKHISLNEGLSQSYVVSILQDSKGFLWFGTQEGLNRFDGYSFKVYFHNQSDTNGISNSKIMNMCLDNRGHIWIATRGGGLNDFDPEKEIFTRYTHDPKNENSISHDETSFVLEDRKHLLWIGTYGGGLNRFDPETRIFTHFVNNPDSKNSISSNCVQTIYEDKNGNIWVGTINGGLNLFDPEKQQFITYKNIPGEANSLSGNSIFSITEDNDGNLWIGTEKNGLNRMNPLSGEIVRYISDYRKSGSLSNNRILSMLKDRKGRIWIGTEGGGINLFNKKLNSFTHFINDPDNPNTLNNNRIWSIFEDCSGILWFGTWGGGINMYNPDNKKFVHYKNDHNNPNSLNDNVIYPIYEDRERMLWIGSQKGLARLDEKTGNFTFFTYSSNNPKGISANDVFAITEDHEGILWVGTWGGGLNRYDRESNIFTSYKNIIGDSSSLSSNNIMCLMEDRYGELWIGTEGGGVNLLGKERKKFRKYTYNPSDTNSLSHNDVFCFNEDKEGNVWVGSWTGGLNKFNRKTGTFTRFVNHPDNANSLVSNSVYVIYRDEDEQNILWIGTGNGLNKFNKSTNTFSCISSKDGLANNTIYSILEDSHDNLWLSTNKGISKYNKYSHKITNFDEEDGLQSNEFNSWSSCKAYNGKFFFGGINGITAFYPDSITTNRYIPPVVITGIQIFNKPIGVREILDDRVILEKSITYLKEITLSYKDYVFAFDFAALSYCQPHKNQYAYIMEGFEKKWNFVGNRRFAAYTNLSPGKYTFRVKASNNDGNWNNTGTSLSIIIVPPFWKTLWFKIASILFIIGSIYLLIYIRIRTIKRQKETLEVLVAERTKELRESNTTKDKFFSIISHDLKSPFNAMLGLSEILARDFRSLPKEKGELFSKQIYHSVKQVYSLVDNLLEWSKTKTNRIVSLPEKMDLKDIAEKEISVVNLVAREKRIEIENNIQENTFVYADPYLVPIILRNLLSNAVKFSKSGGNVTLNERKSESYIEISVTDSGIGINNENIKKLFREDIHFTTAGTDEEKGTGLGLIICKEFVEKNGGRIWVESEFEKGTIFYFTLPKFKG